MKNVTKYNNLPDTFPIRYALIAQESVFGQKIIEKPRTVKEEILFRELIGLLQKEPINKNSFSLNYMCFGFSIADKTYIEIPKLNGTKEWADSLKEEIASVIPFTEAKMTGGGEAFELGLYSYKGAFEKPAFLNIYNDYKKYDLLDGPGDMNPKYGFVGDVKPFYSLYQRIIAGKISNYEFYQSLSRYEKPVNIQIPYSSVWDLLDNNTGKDGFEGVIPTLPVDMFDKFAAPLLTDQQKNICNDKKITAVVCRNWESLFAEELYAIYKILNFCKNCEKPLPFGYKGKYCPEIKENQNCIRERNRKRATKSSQD